MFVAHCLKNTTLCRIELDLKNTQAMVTTENVHPIWSSSLGDGSHFPSATMSVLFFLFAPRRKSGIKSSA